MTGEDFNESTIIDTDVHLRVPKDNLAKYVAEPHRSYLKGPFGSSNDVIWDVNLGGKIQFDFGSGKCLSNSNIKQPSYPVKIEDGRTLVSV